MNFKEKVTRTLGKAVLLGKKYAPDIMVVAGVAGLITAGIVACKATTKAQDIIDKRNKDMEKIEAVKADADAGKELIEPYTEEDYKKDKALTIRNEVVELVKLYGPAILIAAGSAGMVFGSHYILKKRYAAASAGLLAVSKAYADYRKKVAKEYGEDKDIQYALNCTPIQKIETVVTDEGSKSTVSNGYEWFDEQLTSCSPYARVYSKEFSTAWEPNDFYNLEWIKSAQSSCINQLQLYGYLFLNDVYDKLGLDKSIEGQLVGWVSGDELPNFFDTCKRIYPKNFDGDESIFVLDFNVSGNILNRVGLRKDL